MVCITRSPMTAAWSCWNGLALAAQTDQFKQMIVNDESGLILNLFHKRLKVFRPRDLDRLTTATTHEMVTMA